jgi:hypothetical protein
MDDNDGDVHKVTKCNNDTRVERCMLTVSLHGARKW